MAPIDLRIPRVNGLQSFKAWMRRQKLLGPVYFHISYLKGAIATYLQWRNVKCNGGRNGTPNIFIGARYGVETVGNKLILLGLLRSCRYAHPLGTVLVLSSVPAITRQTIDELGVLLAKVRSEDGLAADLRNNVRVISENEISLLGPGDLLIIGGGPINDNREVVKFRLWAEAARRIGARTMIAGCGIGPFRLARARAEMAKLFASVDSALIRNKPPSDIAELLPPGWQLAPDPALLCHDILKAWIEPKRSVVAINGRSVPLDCRLEGELSRDAVVGLMVRNTAPIIRKNSFEQIQPFTSLEFGNQPDSSFAVDAAEMLARRFGLKLLPAPPATLPGMIGALAPAEVAISVRHHGFLIALMLGCKCLVLDYDAAGDGKSRQFQRDWLDRATSASLFSDGDNSNLELVDPAELRFSTGVAQRQYTAAILSCCRNRGAARE